jgi:hypothetical protein
MLLTMLKTLLLNVISFMLPRGLSGLFSKELPHLI